jgi:hypothetical protein
MSIAKKTAIIKSLFKDSSNYTHDEIKFLIQQFRKEYEEHIMERIKIPDPHSLNELDIKSDLIE